MKAKLERFPAKSPNPALSVGKDGTVLYSNEACEPLLRKWGVKKGKRLPSEIGNVVQHVISRKSSEKMEVKVGNRIYLIVFHPISEQECVNISGFDISDQKETDEKLLEIEKNYRMLFTNITDALLIAEAICNKDGKPVDYRIVDINPAVELHTGLKNEQILGRTVLELFPDISPIDLEKYSKVALSGRSRKYEVFNQKFNKFLSFYMFIPEKGKLGLVFRDITDSKQTGKAMRENESLLRQAQEFLEAVTKGTDIIIGAVDTNFCYTYFNKAYLEEVKRLSGREIHIGESMIEIFAHLPEQQKTVIKKWGEVLEGKSYNETLTFGDPCLYQRIYESRRTPIRDAEGKIVGAGEVAYDVTEKVSVQKALSESEEKFRTLFNSIDEGFCLVEVIFDYRGKPVDLLILDHNSVFEQQTGITFDVRRKTIRSVSPMCEDHWIEDLGEIVLTGESARFEKYNQFLERWYTIFASRIGGEGSHYVAFIYDDITERKKAEEGLKKSHDALEERVKERTSELENAYNLLKESEKSLAEAQELAHIGNWSRDIETGKVCWSDEAYRIFGFKPQEFDVTYDSFLSLIHPCDLEFVINAGKQALNGSFLEAEYRLVRNDGVERTVHEKIKVIFDRDNNPIQLKGIVQDITEKKKATEALMKIETARKQEIHHRIKNNLQVISSLLDLQAYMFKNKMVIKQSEVLDAFKESQDRVISMALIHEELYSGKEIDKINFSQYINELSNNLLLTYRVGNDSIILDLDIKEEILFDMDTAVPLGIIINELVSNSLKHAFRGREKGKIQIKLHYDKNVEINSNGYMRTSYILSISDNGIGINENLDIEDLDSLGLQLVTSLVDQLDGELELIRNNGTEFIIKFTLIQETNQASSKLIHSIF